MRRPRVDWMTQADDRILELFEESGLILTPAVLAKNLDYTRNYISDRCRALNEATLLDREGEGFYRITERGTPYLHGELDADDLEDDNSESKGHQ
jgi:predicted transcriptional regulator